MPSFRIAALALAAGAALLVSACQSSVQSSPQALPTSGESAATGQLKVTATDDHGDPISGVEIELERALDCDLTQRVISPGTSYTNHFTDTTNAGGEADFFDLPLGCYTVSAPESSGVQLNGRGPLSAFLTEAEPVQTLALAFGRSNKGRPGDCDAQEISDDLDIPEEQREAEATVAECEPNWAVIRWDTPGDSQRVVRYFGDKWVTYVVFPTDRCWKQAKHDGAPQSFEKYFQPC